jgi:adenylylsulfate kinase
MKLLINKILFIKSTVYRCYSALITFFIAWIITGQLGLSITIGITDIIFKIFSYYLFDLIWFKMVYNYKPCVIWLTGLSGSGKTTIANGLFEKLKEKNMKCVILDGDEIRTIFPLIGFDKVSRINHNINVGYMASLLEKQGYIVIVSLISPFAEARDRCRTLINNFIEVHLKTSLEVCEKRDVKGLYVKARNGDIKDFSGISSPYEEPINPELRLDTEVSDLDFCVRAIMNKLKK